jgi:hypothetical protein
MSEIITVGLDLAQDCAPCAVGGNASPSAVWLIF